METYLICLAVALGGGLMLSRVTKLFHLPAVTAYLVAGLLLGPFFLGRIGLPGLGVNSLEQVEHMSIMTQTALGFIAFTIGNEFRLSQLKAMGSAAIIIGILGYIILNRSKFGRSIAAIGGNPETAYLAGIPVVKRRIIIYIAVGVLAAFTGIIWAARFASGIPGAGDGVNLKIMAAVIIGGTSPSGGSGTILGTAIGCVLLATITNFLILVGIPSTAQMLIFGVILILAIFIDKYRRVILSGK